MRDMKTEPLVFVNMKDLESREREELVMFLHEFNRHVANLAKTLTQLKTRGPHGRALFNLLSTLIKSKLDGLEIDLALYETLRLTHIVATLAERKEPDTRIYGGEK
ncbi:MAG: hypothetical protein DRJ52_08375 [Thermoprotei archaeon]|nr:MAG: hypothetical protein DRJ52_08375 [Thermoprotei archaeon]